MADNYVIHYYPDYIRNDTWENRKIEITVKSNETINGNAEELKKSMNKADTDVAGVINNDGDIWEKNKRTPSDINTSKIITNTKRLQNAKSLYTIVLPLPNELVDSQTHAWEAENGLLSGMLSNTLGSAKVNMSANTDGTDKVSKGASAVLQKFDSFANGVIKAAPKAIANASSSLGFRKPLVDPGWFANYSGTRPRFFSLSFDMMPNNANEAENILNIIMNLKKFALPSTVVNGVALLSPYMFEIKFGNEKLERLINMSNVVLNNMDVNYSGDGTMQLFPNGMPMYIRLTLSFMEANVVTSEFY